MTGALTCRGDLPAGLALALALHLAGLLLLGGIQAGTSPSLVPPRARRVAVRLMPSPPPRAVTAAPRLAQPYVTARPLPPAAPPAPRAPMPSRVTPPDAPARAAGAPKAAPVPILPTPSRRLAAVPDGPERARPADLLPAVLADTEALDGDVDAAPRPRQTIHPVYPLESRQRGESGNVVAVVHVTDGGRVARVDIARSSGHTALDRAARAALLAARFDPARRGASAVPARVRLTIVFMLKGVGR